MVHGGKKRFTAESAEKFRVLAKKLGWYKATITGTKFIPHSNPLKIVALCI